MIVVQLLSKKNYGCSNSLNSFVMYPEKIRETKGSRQQGTSVIVTGMSLAPAAINALKWSEGGVH